MSDLVEKGQVCYLALIGDLRRSRDAPNRALIQKRLESTLTRANREAHDDLAAGLVITLGDEFQALLRRPEAVLQVIVILESALEEIPVRYGLGWGGLSTDLRPTAIGMDGPCFHAAREALAEGKRANRWITISGLGAEADQILNGILGLMGTVRARWTPIQARTVSQMRTASTQREVAATRRVSESTVSKALNAALYDSMIDVEHAVRALLRQFTESHAPEQDSVGRQH